VRKIVRKRYLANRVGNIEETERRSLFRTPQILFEAGATVLAGPVALSGSGHFDVEIFDA